jgi:tetratricopeptide (TPR) repeat protein
MSIKYFLLFGALSFLGVSLQGQSKHYAKAVKCFEKGKYSKALKSIDKAKTDRNVLNKSSVYLLESKLFLKQNELMPSEDLTKKAVKSAIKALDKSANSQKFVQENAAFYAQIASINMRDAMRYYNQKRYSKSITLFKRSLDLSKDSFVEYLLGKSYILYNDYRRGMPILDELLNRQFAHYQKTKVAPKFLADGFNVYTEALISKGFSDSAEIYLDMGLEMFPTDIALLAKQKVIWQKMVGKIPLSLSLYQFLDNATDVYPYDSFFTFKKNGVYLMFMANQLSGKKMMGSSDWVSDFIREKTHLAETNQKEIHKKWDYFLEKDSQVILEKLVFYFGNFEEYKIQRAAFQRYAKAKFGSNNLKAIKHLQTLFPPSQVAKIYRQELKEASTSKGLIQRYEWYETLLARKDKDAEVYEALLTINSDISSNQKSSKEKKKLNNQYIELIKAYWKESLTNNNYWKAYELGYLAQNLNDNEFQVLWEKTVVNDFRNNYFGSRVLKDVAGTQPFGFTWNGSASACYPGYLPDSILKKVIQRINYFRRTAGLLDPVALNINYNNACQEAALFYTANRNLTHELNKNLLCYSGSAATAGAKSLLTAGAHTTLAITSFMADKSKSAGNRRWILYPPTKFMGFGCTDDRTALWCVNDQKWDTSTYVNQSVSWPPKGFSPSIFQFENWSYSSYQNFKGAHVQMFNLEDDKEISCQIMETVRGYGMPTLVWKPNLKRKIKAKTSYKVVITLKSGKKISYIVNLIPVNV